MAPDERLVSDQFPRASQYHPVRTDNASLIFFRQRIA